MCCLGRQTLVTSTKVTVAAPQADVKAAMMAKLEAEAANLKKVLARQQAEKQAIAQSQQPSEHHSNQPGDKTSTAQVDSTPAVARDSKSTNPLKQYPQDTLSVVNLNREPHLVYQARHGTLPVLRSTTAPY